LNGKTQDDLAVNVLHPIAYCSLWQFRPEKQKELCNSFEELDIDL
jgi:hypothetical protein